MLRSNEDRRRAVTLAAHTPDVCEDDFQRSLDELMRALTGLLSECNVLYGGRGSLAVLP